ncbi:flagellin [Arthrobacter sp. H20]|uniref:flagellin N-terminal helical domain-containing protein n=1 Tax=Arthrobacter sp. H20 TaxID=1267981 RepID=UPI00047941E6|nr:flagellin [Arthrobacter sp. H20]
MGFQINTNVSAMNAYRNLSMTQNDMSKSLEKLSSGLRINRAADDAAGLALAEGLKSQVGGLTVASRNAQDGIGVVQTAEGALTEVHSILQRMRDLAVQAGNDSNNVESREAIKTEVDGLTAEIGRIAENTNFNGNKLLNGEKGVMSFQVGAEGDANSKIDVSLAKANVSSLANTLNGVDATGAALVGSDNLTGVKFAANSAGTYTISQGAATFDLVLTGTETEADISTKLQTAAGTGTDFTVSGNNTDGFSIVSTQPDSVDAVTIGVTGTALTAAGTTGNVAAGLAFESNAEAQASINILDRQIETISSARSELGAVQNRFESTIKNVNVSIENLSAAESRIRDTDMAKEMADYTRSSILSQAGTAMLAQANQMNQGVLQLLG